MNIKILLLLLFLFKSVNASSYPSFTNHELSNIQKKFGSIAKNRVVDYTETMNTIKHYPKKKQLIRVNFYLNQLLPQVDLLNQNQIDYWETPKEFLIRGYGDCEDYAIIKYFTLLKLGFSHDKLFLTTVYEKYTGQLHMVLSYFESKNKPPLILDNLSFRILDIKQRNDLKVDKFINSDGVYKLSRYNNLIKVSNEHKKFKGLMKRIKKEY